MSDRGLAFEVENDGPGGWSVTATGRIARATSIADKVRRQLRPFFGPVAFQPERGITERLTKKVPAAPAIVAERARFLLSGMVRDGEISNVTTQVDDDPNNAKRLRLVLTFLDMDKKQHTLTEFVSVP